MSNIDNVNLFYSCITIAINENQGNIHINMFIFGSECRKIVWNLRALARRISYLCPKGFSDTPDTFPWPIGSFPALLLMTILIFYSQTIDIDFIPVAKSDLLGWSQLRWQQPGVYLVRTINSAVAQLICYILER